MEHLRRAAADVARREQLDLVVLFGSTARGDRASGSDIDLGVLGPSTIDMVMLTNAFIQALREQEVDLVNLRHADPLLLMLVARDGVALFERDPSTFDQFASLAARRYADTKKFRDLEAERIREFVAARTLGR